MIVFIEFWKAKSTWMEQSQEQRAEFVGKMGPVIADMASKGVDFYAWGLNEDTTPQKSEYDFYAVTSLPNNELLTQLQQIIQMAGWYDYFEQVNMTGTNLGPQEVIGRLVGL